jgi:hypothetical protein
VDMVNGVGIAVVWLRNSVAFPEGSIATVFMGLMSLRREITLGQG